VKTQRPRVDPLVLPELIDEDPAVLLGHRSYEAMRFADADVAGADLSGISLIECALSNWSAHETSLRSARLLQTRVERLNAPILSAGRIELRDVEISGSRVGSAELYDASMTQVVVSSSKLGWVNMRSTTLRDVLFRDCSFDELDLGGADIARVAFENCTAGSVALRGAKIAHLDLRGLDLRAIDGVEGLRGATISGEQLAVLGDMFAQHFGIRVDE
jgi:uncharacterized protein YjbI with pentapeptide repeats